MAMRRGRGKAREREGRRESGRGQVQCEVMDLRNALIAVVYPFKKQCNTQAEYDAVLAGSHTQTVC